MQTLNHIQMLLQGLKKKIDAKQILLLETTGQVLCQAPLSPGLTGGSTEAFVALIIGVNAASQQLGSILGDASDPILVREGQAGHLLSLFVSKDVILAVLIKKEEKMGFVKFKVKQYQPVLKALVTQWKKQRQQFTNPLKDVTEAELDNLLRF